jgi:hypothetical protein
MLIDSCPSTTHGQDDGSRRDDHAFWQHNEISNEVLISLTKGSSAPQRLERKSL